MNQSTIENEFWHNVRVNVESRHLDDFCTTIIPRLKLITSGLFHRMNQSNSKEIIQQILQVAKTYTTVNYAFYKSIQDADWRKMYQIYKLPEVDYELMLQLIADPLKKQIITELHTKRKSPTLRQLLSR
jgi:hypothetical protein